MAQTLVEKIAERFAVGLRDGQTVRAGDFVSIRPAHVMTHDNTAAVIPKFESMGATRMFDAHQPVFALDHDIQNTTPENLAKYAKIESFARKHGVTFYPAGRGIGHQVMVEEGYVLPGTFVVASDSHSNLYGALGALGTPVVRTDAAAIWATGQTWWQVPDVVRVKLTGKLRSGVSGKDVIIALCGVFNHDEVLNCCIEFAGDGLASLSIDERMSIANMTTEWGALSGVFPCDEVTRDYLRSRARLFEKRGDDQPRLTCEALDRLLAEVPVADDDAYYAKELELDLSAVAPFVAGPNEVKTMTPLGALEARGVQIDKAFLMSCVNGRLSDFREAAEVLRGRRVHAGVKLYVAAASDEVEREAKSAGYWSTLVEAGAIELPPGCGACIGLGEGVLEDGEVGISATNRNFKGRMGSRDSQVYLSSPAVVAASAVAGRIAGPKGTGGADDARTSLEQGAAVRVCERQHTAKSEVSLLPGFPECIEGEVLFIPKDNLNTDGIYGKEYTYQDDLTPEQMGSKAMANHDPRFQELARVGDVLVGGFNFGSGSSREQAATALKHRGIRMIIAGSYSQTYKRNAFNNGFVVIECPELVETLKARFAGEDAPTIRTGVSVRVDFTRAIVEADGKSYAFGPLGEVAQELIVKGGFDAVIRDQLAALDQN